MANDFLKEEGAHGSNFEWWYVNGHLNDSAAKNKLVSFALAIFKYKKNIQQPAGSHNFYKDYEYQVHFSFLDHESKKFSYKTTVINPVRFFHKIRKNTLEINFKNLKLMNKDNHYYLSYKDHNFFLKLKMSFNNRVFEHGEDQTIKLGVGRSKYYSIVNLETTGHIQRFNKNNGVSGATWIDHQWGNWTDHKIFWFWISLQLENNEQVMIYRIFNSNNSPEINSLTLLNKHGEQQKFENPEIHIMDYWISPRNNLKYPIKFKIRFDSYELIIEAVIPDQEINSAQVDYWEGACQVLGTVNNQPITGAAYLETIGQYNY